MASGLSFANVASIPALQADSRCLPSAFLPARCVSFNRKLSCQFISKKTSQQCRASRLVIRAESQPPSGRIITGPAFVVQDNIDTDQIIPAEYLTLVPSVPEEYTKLGSYAMIGLPEDKYPTRFILPGSVSTTYPIMIGGDNFGCGSSREHAPVAMGAAGCKVVVAGSYARIFFRNCVATGELYPVETEERLCDVVKTGEEVTVDMEHDLLIHHPTGKQFALRPLGEAGPVIDAGGIFNYARATGMIAAKA
eukprot:TRINITY_DN38579_c0_g1_i1.p1 TRINITY_DN38579_c0_g1~~TRINITY_DN38579_c0_g1_i1.p1  ORF type:complete len:251 (+),score=17.30 TRINITY_DN38579_c0_g1_i1:151-903(+)